jgi:methylated-DNA-[protein]-cysteine S-methyltransferase
MSRPDAERDDELIAVLLGDARPSVELERWFQTRDGLRELAAYRQALGALGRLYGEVRPPRPRRTVYYCALRTPIGRVLVAATEAGLVRVSFRQSEASFAGDLRRRLGADVVRSPARTADIVHQLRAYFAGERRTFDVRVDLSGLTPFHRAVLLAAASVPAGQVVSYGEIARRIGQPGGSRAVGQALGRNPVPIVIPCHRVIAAGGKIGGYGGGLAIKRKLLRMEGAVAAAAG